MKKQKLDAEEAALEAAFEAGEFVSDFSAERAKEIQAIAKESAKKNKRINIRISDRDLKALQRRALREGLPYQTLVSSILHKYASGHFQDIATESH